MSRTYLFTCGRLSRAVRALVSEGALRDRLLYAAREATFLQEADFPDELQERWRGWRAAVTRAEPVGDEGSIAASVRLMSEEQAGWLAVELLEIYRAMDRTEW